MNADDRYMVRVTYETIKLNSTKEKGARAHDKVVREYDEMTYGSKIAVDQALHNAEGELLKLGITLAKSLGQWPGDAA